MLEDRLFDHEIAVKVGVTKITLERWKRLPDFQARVERLREATRAKLERDHIADKQYRINALIDRDRRLELVITERAAEEGMAAVPGGRSGLLARSYKALGSGENMSVITEYAIDGVLLKEMREIEKQAAIELEEWTERKEVGGAGGGPLLLEFVNDWRTHREQPE